MYTKIALEMFAYGNINKQGRWLGWNKERPFVARINGFNYETGELQKNLVYGYVDYARSNSTGSRGVYKYYFLEDGIYEINRRVTWKKTEHYFIQIKDKAQTELSFDEVLECLKRD